MDFFQVYHEICVLIRYLTKLYLDMDEEERSNLQYTLTDSASGFQVYQ